MDLDSLLEETARQGASDLHIKVGNLPMLRIHGRLQALHASLPEIKTNDIDTILNKILDEKGRKYLEQNKEFDLAYSLKEIGRFRINIFKQRGTYALVIRSIPYQIPSIRDLHLPLITEKLSDSTRGLILFTGETGSGKSTSLAAFVNTINQKYYKHIITVEDPIEYLIPDDKSIITQREVGVDTDSFEQALRASLRQDPDVILIGELRDKDSIKTALMAAETGHLVISTLHTVDARETILRILSYFEPHQQQQIQLQLAANLKAVFSQRLLARKDRTGFIPAVEVLLNSQRVSEAITDLDKLLDLKTVIEEGHIAYGMQTFEQDLLSLLKRDLISEEEARQAASNVSDFDLRLAGIYSLDRQDHPDRDFYSKEEKSEVFSLQLEDTKVARAKKKKA